MGKTDKNMTGKQLQKSYFDVLGLCCSSEIPLVEKALKRLDGVKEISVIVPTKTVIVVHDSLLVSQFEIVKALNDARLEANVRVYGKTKHRMKWPNPYTIACGVLLLMSFLKYAYRPFGWLALGAVAVGILPIVLRAIASLRNFRLDINILVIIAVIGSIAMGDYLEAGTIVFLFTIAEWLESRASHKATSVMSSLMSLAPQKAILAETGEEVNANEVKLDTVLSVKAGEVIPIDGIVMEGECEVDEKTLTGESFPVSKQKYSTVWAGTINVNGYISIKTTAIAENCVVAKMAKLVEEAQNNKSRTERLVDQCAQYYTPAIVLIAIGLAVIPLAFKVHSRNFWFRLALVVLVSACPCALVLSTPVATFCALIQAATSGLLVKGGAFLEILAKVKNVAFDKTGTVTKGEFSVTEFKSLCEDVSSETLLYWVSSIESKSGHPLAAALVDYGKMNSVQPKPENVEDFKNFAGEGIYGKIDGSGIHIGNRKIALRAGCHTVPTLEADAKGGKTTGYVFNGVNLVGIFSLSDDCRTGAMEAIKELKSLGVKTAMLTGDNHAAAMEAQDQLKNALEIIHADLLPEDKARIIQDLKKEGPTAMVGDGMNDAPALATADVGISMGISGSALATETGHMILMSNDMGKLPKAIRLARRTHRKVIQNVILSISTKVAILALAFAGHPIVWGAVLADTGTCLLVIFNSMLLLRGKHNHGGKCSKSSSSDSHSHKKQICCSGSGKGPKANEPQKCSSKCNTSQCDSNSCEKSTCTSLEEQKGCTNSEPHKAFHCDQGSCGASRIDNCTSLAERRETCVGGHEHSEVDGSDIRECARISFNAASCQSHNDLIESFCPSELGHENATVNGHCHSNNCLNDIELGEIKQTGCGHHQTHCFEVQSSCRKRCVNKCHAESMAVHACLNLEKREIGGCCQSYRNECCGHHGHFGGVLSEIVIE
ncbi:hypothetical protein RJ641_013277 [Dillenia turbinata]|uniref:HMA domain-containing protein n=1 Tax=Dillenia turbinata TaxID=194707 RepID=A0AAN8WFL9_9MAGN